MLQTCANEQGSNQLEGFSEVRQILNYRSMFWKPDYPEGVVSSWIEHVPFAFWIVEAHRPHTVVELGTHFGMSYFSFCQAVERLELDARCFAVDTWKGDEHAGLYDNSVYEKVRLFNEEKYSTFSRLIRSKFDEALPHFSDGTIDLLHIDGHHSLESVKHDFDSWLPKLSSKGLVLLHDTNVRERGFGVFQLMEQLQEIYPTFDFIHGHGLGVVAVGPDQTDATRALIAAGDKDKARREIHDIFGRLGRAFALSIEISRLRSREEGTAQKAKTLQQRLDETIAQRDKANAELAQRTRERDEARREIQKVRDSNATERGTFAAKAEGYQELCARLTKEADELRLQINALQNETTARLVQDTSVRKEAEFSRREAEQAQGLLKSLEAEVRDLREKAVATDRGKVEFELLSRDLEAARKEVVFHRGEAEHAQGLLKSLEVEVRDLREKVIETDNRKVEFELLSRELEAARARLREEDTRMHNLREAAAASAAIAEDAEKLRKELYAAQSLLADREQSLRKLEDEASNARVDLKREIDMLTAKNTDLESEIKARFKEVAMLTQDLMVANNKVNQEAGAKTELQKEIAAANAKIEKLVKHTDLQNELRARFNEVATLTRDLMVANNKVNQEARAKTELQKEIAAASAKIEKLRQQLEEMRSQGLLSRIRRPASQLGSALLSGKTSLTQRLLGGRVSLRTLYVTQGDTYNALRQWEKAAEQYRLALAIDPALVAIWIQLGHCLREMGDLDQAEQVYGRVVKISPAESDGWFFLGVTLQANEKLDSAREAYAKAAELNPAGQAAQALNRLLTQ